jgi:hypothetical protein
MDQIEIYNGYNIHAFESSPGKWTAEIRKVDGSQIQILLPELGEDVLDCLTTDPETMSPEAAIELAKQAIDGGGMR